MSPGTSKTESLGERAAPAIMGKASRGYSCCFCERLVRCCEMAFTRPPSVQTNTHVLFAFAHAMLTRINVCMLRYLNEALRATYQCQIRYKDNHCHVPCSTRRCGPARRRESHTCTRQRREWFTFRGYLFSEETPLLTKPVFANVQRNKREEGKSTRLQRSSAGSCDAKKQPE